MNHTHRYTRINIGKDGKEYWVMKCNLPGCNSYTPGKSKLSFQRLHGQIALCNKCQEKFELTRRSLRAAKPICEDCIDTRDTKDKRAANEFFDTLLQEVKDGTNS